MNERKLAIAACLVLMVPAYFGLLWSNVPSLISPFPLVTVLPAFMLGRAAILATAVPSLLFTLWMPNILRGEKKVPLRSLILLSALSGLTALYFKISWSDGATYQGAQFTYGMCLANALWLVALWIVFIHGYRKPSFKVTLLAHWLLFAWLGWCGFPYLGELP